MRHINAQTVGIKTSGTISSMFQILANGCLCLYIGIKGADNKPGEEKSKEVACAVSCVYPYNYDEWTCPSLSFGWVHFQYKAHQE